MGKISKYGSSIGGDERNSYDRRLKAASNPPKAPSSLADRRVEEPESNSRSKNSGNSSRHNQGTGKHSQKSKLRSPVPKAGLGQSTSRVNRPNTVTTKTNYHANKELKKTSETNKTKSEMTKMKQETENSEKKQKSVTENKEINEPVEQKQIHDLGEQLSEQHENGSANGVHAEEIQIEINPTENDAKENGKSSEEIVIIIDEDFDLQLDPEDNVEVIDDSQKTENNENVSENETKSLTDEAKAASQTDAESCSVDVVESTTSELSEATESSTPSEVKDKEVESKETNNDAVVYDSNIMLKDVQIKLNDCLKDSKIAEENKADQSLPEYAYKEETFGKTLRTISGRKSIGRHITIRDRQLSPNSSLFVNTSSASVNEDIIPDFKVLRHRSALSELSASNNGTPIDRKRKLAPESPDTSKKPRTESSLLNASFEFLKYPFSPRRPVQISTPYNFKVEKHNISASEEVKVDEGNPKKWCSIM